MTKITFIGAGSLGFTRGLVRDVLTFPLLRDATLCLMDIDPERLHLLFYRPVMLSDMPELVICEQKLLRKSEMRSIDKRLREPCELAIGRACRVVNRCPNATVSQRRIRVSVVRRQERFSQTYRCTG